ncbi:MAG: hypothetical protein C0478_16635 [Planctomyces sp.]|nr:hypothetical protein [Planctomyces sp.]
MRDISSVRSLEDLRAFVHQELCRFENLLIEQFQLSESRILRNGELCGLQFMLQGPRNVRLNAVWAADNNDLYFYNTRGERFAKLRVMTPLADQLTRAAG